VVEKKEVLSGMRCIPQPQEEEEENEGVWSKTSSS
jgi:hypothetical protein